MLKKLFSRKKGKAPKATIVPRKEHTFSRQLVSKNALNVLYRLHDADFDAYLVGGCVRDILLGIKPKDFDVATNAKPEQVRKLFRNCRLIGRRFRLAHIYFGREIIEVATFREEPNKFKAKKSLSSSGRILSDNVYGDITSDALRRDFTINALYYNIADFSIVDYCKGLPDIEARRLQLIGDPVIRYREDPIRILRAIRFSAKLGLTIAEETAKPILACAKLLADVPKSRTYEECLKLFLTGHGLASFEKLQEYQLLPYLLPPSKAYTEEDYQLIKQGLSNSDKRVQAHQSTSPGFLFALLLWPAYTENSDTDNLFYELSKTLSIPKRFSLVSKSMWELQHRLTMVKRHQAYRLLSHPSFRAAYDFLKLRAQFDSSLAKRAEWWHQFQHADKTFQSELLEQLPKVKGRPRRRRRKNEDA